MKTTDLNKASNEEEIYLTMNMLQDFFPKTYEFMTKKNPKTLEEFKIMLHKIDRTILDEETKKEVDSLKHFASKNGDITKEFEAMELDNDTPQAIFNRYKAASWIIISNSPILYSKEFLWF
ncbi:hypothetical protein VSU16_14555 (plasmid) [Cetobacterium somerae]|uniref:hypothetical protein n=1 Tax=Cetobacterium somerae TaxID=188913 RepID=UPI002E7B8B07|nr:hypothetical protein [Cetobacterium somerae]WVJ03142.1 hypothetical protein VSU16_14555 [Cetobacterium somerae]